MDNKMFEQVRKLEDYMAEKFEDTDEIDELIAIASGYACAYIPLFDEVRTDASDSMMLLKTYLNTLKKFERKIVEKSIRKMIEFKFSDDNKTIYVKEYTNEE